MGRGRSQTADISVSLFFLKKHLSFSFSGIDIPLDCSEILERMLNMSIATVFHKFLSFSFSGTSTPLDCSESLERMSNMSIKHSLLLRARRTSEIYLRSL